MGLAKLVSSIKKAVASRVPRAVIVIPVPSLRQSVREGVAHAEVRQWLLLVGVPSFVIRFMWRSVWWFCWEKRLERKRQARVLVFDGLNDGQAGGNEIAPSTTIDDDERSFLTLSRPGSMDDDISSRSLT